MRSISNVLWIGFLLHSAVAGQTGFEWRLMPLRTAAMQQAGLAGGDGFQQVMGLSFAPSDPSRVYAVIDCAQVWRSDDGGSHWTMATAGFRANGGVDLAVDPLNPEVVYVAGSQGGVELTAPEADGVYRTLDGGTTWQRVLPAQFYKLPIYRGGSLFWLDPSPSPTGRSREVVVAVQDGRGLFRSQDGGTTWQPAGGEGMGLVYDLQPHPSTPEFWVSTETGLWVVSFVRGRMVKRAVDAKSVGLPTGKDQLVSRVLFNTNDPGVVYAICGTAGFYRSTDGGKRFQPSHHGIPDTIAGTRPAAMLDRNPIRPDWLVLGFHKVKNGNFMSYDAGKTWRPFENLDATGMVLDLDAERQPNSFFVGHKTAFHPTDPHTALIPGSVWELQKTQDGGKSWRFSGNGFCGARVGVGRSSFHFPPDRPGELTLFCIDYGPFRSDDGGQTFRTLSPIRVDGARTAPVGAVHPNDPSVVICPLGHWNDQKLCRTIDGGLNWAVVHTEKQNFRFLAFHPQQPSVIYAGALRSDDGGTRWKPLPYPVMDMDPAQGDVIYGMESLEGETQVHRSTDRGETWSPVGTALPVTGVHELAVDHRLSPARIYVPTPKGLAIFEGGKWELRNESNGLPRDGFGEYSLRNVVVDPLRADVVYLSRLNAKKGHSDGIWRSRDAGATWVNLAGNLGPEMTAWSMQFDQRTDRLYIGTSQGTWYLEHPAE